MLISPADAARPVTLARDTNLVALLGPQGRIATGDPAHVPVGRYAQAALTWMGQWDAVSPRLARADNVRSALLLVERGEAPYGIVYATDAAAEPNVKIVGTFPDGSHPPIIYPAAIVKDSKSSDARPFLDLLKSAKARPAFEKQGFTVLVTSNTAT